MNKKVVEHQALAWSEISLPALQHNLHIIKRVAGSAKIMLVLKANAYGHGASEIASHIDVDALAVARIEEAEHLRASGFNGQLLLLSPLLTDHAIQAANKLSLDIVLHSESAARKLLKYPLCEQLNIWIKVDTGMHRLGMLPNTAEQLIPELIAHPKLNTLSLMSHFASSEDSTARKNSEQLEKMLHLHTKFPQIPICFANSGALFFNPKAHFDWVRAGISLYGISPSLNTQNNHLDQLIPAMTLKARVVDVKTIHAGETVGYGSTWRAATNTQIAIIAIGYGDGYPRHAKAGTPVLINGERFKLAGTVSMDLITVDIGEASVKPNDIATLWGETLPVNEVAYHAGTIGYELVTRISQRVKRLYQY